MLAPDRYLAFAVMALINVAACALCAPLIATLQTLVPSHMRATIPALSTLHRDGIGSVGNWRTQRYHAPLGCNAIPALRTSDPVVESRQQADGASW